MTQAESSAFIFCDFANLQDPRKEITVSPEFPARSHENKDQASFGGVSVPFHVSAAINNFLSNPDNRKPKHHKKKSDLSRFQQVFDFSLTSVTLTKAFHIFYRFLSSWIFKRQINDQTDSMVRPQHQIYEKRLSSPPLELFLQMRPFP